MSVWRKLLLVHLLSLCGDESPDCAGDPPRGSHGQHLRWRAQASIASGTPDESLAQCFQLAVDGEHDGANCLLIFRSYQAAYSPPSG